MVVFSSGSLIRSCSDAGSCHHDYIEVISVCSKRDNCGGKSGRYAGPGPGARARATSVVRVCPPCAQAVRSVKARGALEQLTRIFLVSSHDRFRRVMVGSKRNLWVRRLRLSPSMRLHLPSCQRWGKKLRTMLFKGGTVSREISYTRNLKTRSSYAFALGPY